MEKNNTLLALNQKILTYCLEILGIEKEITNLADVNEDEFRNAKDLRKAIHPKVNHENLDFYNSVPYFQNFGSKFAPNLSIIDLLMCEGPQARLVIQNSHK